MSELVPGLCSHGCAQCLKFQLVPWASFCGVDYMRCVECGHSVFEEFFTDFYGEYSRCFEGLEGLVDSKGSMQGCSRCDIRLTACGWCRPTSTYGPYGNRTRLCLPCASETGKLKDIVLAVEFSAVQMDSVELKCRMISGKEVFRATVGRSPHELHAIRDKLADMLSTFVPEDLPRMARDGALYDKSGFEAYYGDRGAGMWAQAVYQTCRLVFLLPDGSTWESSDAIITAICNHPSQVA